MYIEMMFIVHVEDIRQPFIKPITAHIVFRRKNGEHFVMFIFIFILCWKIYRYMYYVYLGNT